MISCATIMPLAITTITHHANYYVIHIQPTSLPELQATLLMTVPLRPLWRKHYASTSRLSSRGPAMFVVTAANLPPSDIPITSTTQSNAPGVVFGKTSGLSLNTPSQLTFKRPTTASAASPKFKSLEERLLAYVSLVRLEHILAPSQMPSLQYITRSTLLPHRVWRMNGHVRQVERRS